MQAFEIRYSPDGERVALGWQGGLLAIHAVDAADGSPAEEMAQVFHHEATLIRVGWIDQHSLASVSADGAWAVSDAATGEVKRSGRVAGEYLSADLSPSGASLFFYAYDGSERGWRVATADGSVTEGPALDDSLSVTSRVFAVSDAAALYRFVRSEGEDVVEGFARADFSEQTVTERTFALGPRSAFNEDGYLMAVDPVRGIGVRPDYEPVERVGDEETGVVVIRAEVFDLDTLEPRERKVVMGWPRAHLEGPYAGLRTAAPGTDEFAEAQDWLVRKLASAAFVRDAPHVWFGLGVGAARRIALDGDHRDVPVFHGGGADPGPPGLDDLFARDLVSLRTLGVSDDGAYVGFGNPNAFFSLESIALDGATEPIRLPPRRVAIPETEMPGLVRFAGERLVVFDRGDRMHFADGLTGEPERIIELGEYYGEATDAALSSGGDRLVIAVAGGSSLCWDEEAGVTELPVPPHGVLASFVGDHRAVVVHHGGAVVRLDFENQEVESVRAPEDDGEPAEEDWDAFEQRWDLRGAATYSQGGTPYVATVDEHDTLQLYSVDESIEVAEALEHRAGRLAGGDGWLASTGGSDVQVMTMPGATVVRTVPFGRVTAVQTGDESGDLYAFDDASGQLVRIAGDEPEVRFTYEGPSVAGVHLSERLRRVAVITAGGPIEVYDLDSGERLAVLRVLAGESGRTLTRD